MKVSIIKFVASKLFRPKFLIKDFQLWISKFQLLNCSSVSDMVSTKYVLRL